jgi:hypothetical protein
MPPVLAPPCGGGPAGVVDAIPKGAPLEGAVDGVVEPAGAVDFPKTLLLFPGAEVFSGVEKAEKGFEVVPDVCALVSSGFFPKLKSVTLHKFSLEIRFLPCSQKGIARIVPVEDLRSWLASSPEEA